MSVSDPLEGRATPSGRPSSATIGPVSAAVAVNANGFARLPGPPIRTMNPPGWFHRRPSTRLRRLNNKRVFDSMPRKMYIYKGMDAKAKRALSTLRRCVAQDRVGMSRHFKERMEQRGLLWPDILVVIDAPSAVRPDGLDRFGRPKWILTGRATDGLGLEIVFAIRTEPDEAGVFITIYWE